MRKILLFILALALLQSVSIAQQAPDFTLTDCNGASHHLYGDLAAGKAVIINFCAGWCGPCRNADPKLEAIYQQYCQGAGNVKVYGMLFEDYEEQLTDCTFGQQYAADFGLTFPLFTNIGTTGPISGLTGDYVNALGLALIPTFYIIIPNTSDPANSAVYTIVGDSPSLENDILNVLSDNGFEPSNGFELSISISGNFCSNPPYSATLTSNLASGNTWSTGATTQSITVYNSGTYTLTGNMGGCSITVSENIEFNPIPGTASASSNTVCQNGQITLNYTPGGASDETWVFRFPPDATWYDLAPASYGPVDVEIPQSPGTLLKFAVRSTNGSAGSCITYSNEVQVTVNNDQPGAAPGTVSVSGNSVCLGATYTVSYSGNAPGAVWQAYDENSGQWYIFSPAYQGPLEITAQNPGSLINGLPGDRFRVKIPSGSCYLISNVLEVVYTMPEVTITVTPANNTYTGGIPTNIYLGYGPQSVTLGANSSCPNFSYRYWSGPYLSCNECDHPVFAPTAPGNYEIVCFVLNEWFDYTYQIINFCVIDVKVPNQNNKVYLCHNNSTHSVNTSGVNAHLVNHPGDALGKCNQNCSGSEAGANEALDRSGSSDEIKPGLNVNPNPAQDEITVSFYAESKASYTIKLINFTGQTVLSMRRDAVEGDNAYPISMKNLPPGMYLIALQSGKTVMQKMIVKVE